MSEDQLEIQEEKEDTVIDLKENNESEEIEEAEEKVEEKEEVDYKSKYFYLAAEMNNMQKRFDREMDSLRKYGNEKVLKSLLDVIDNFERSIISIDSDGDDKLKSIVEGIDMVKNLMLDTLKNHGLEQLETVGKEFDPNHHEAVSQAQKEGANEDEIIQEYQKGYLLNGRLLRAAKVVIAKN